MHFFVCLHILADGPRAPDLYYLSFRICTSASAAKGNFEKAYMHDTVRASLENGDIAGAWRPPGPRMSFGTLTWTWSFHGVDDHGSYRPAIVYIYVCALEYLSEKLVLFSGLLSVRSRITCLANTHPHHESASS